MVSHMKTTLNIDDSTMERLRDEARRQERTMSELVEVALRQFLRQPKRRGRLPRLPSFSGGRLLADVADRDELYRAMEER